MMSKARALAGAAPRPRSDARPRRAQDCKRAGRCRRFWSSPSPRRVCAGNGSRPGRRRQGECRPLLQSSGRCRGAPRAGAPAAYVFLAAGIPSCIQNRRQPQGWGPDRAARSARGFKGGAVGRLAGLQALLGPRRRGSTPAGRLRWSVETMIPQPAAAVLLGCSPQNAGLAVREARVGVAVDDGRTAAEAFGAATGAMGRMRAHMAPPLRGVRR